MHYLQKHILKKLTVNKEARYSDMKPSGIESNLFSYHAKSLVDSGHIILKNGSYRLTALGRQYVDRVSFETFGERIQPKIVTLVVLEDKGKYLLYKRKRSPFIDHVGFPYGKIHLEERVEEAAHRELQEKTGLSAELRHRGEVYITVHDETELISHMLCHVFTGKKFSGELRSASTIGECFWGDVEEIKKTDLIPGVQQIIKLLKGNKSLFFAEYFLNTSEE
jgi:ADP-ribose pyrophosphatase YjhB (NUDIX family)